MVNTGRRSFITGLMAATLTPRATWADAGSPAFLSAAKTPEGHYVLCGLGDDLSLKFQLPLPTRGHAAAAHPTRAEAVAFARRPGTYAIVIDCVTGDITTTLTAPQDRHFYGHGVFSADGSLLFTTENDYDNGRGRIGVWDGNRDYARIDEWDSGGIGPHDIKRLPGSDTLIVANGGIDTHPDTGRTKLNIPTMRSNLSYVQGGVVQDQMELGEDHQRNSIRHLAVSREGKVAFGMQWQGDAIPPALVGVHSFGNQPQLMECPTEALIRLDGYIGSIAFNNATNRIAVTSPRGGQVHLYAVDEYEFTGALVITDVCGVAVSDQAFVTTSGEGNVGRVFTSAPVAGKEMNLSWDNHLIAL